MKYVFHEGGPTKGFTILWGVIGIKKFENPWSGVCCALILYIHTAK